MVDGWWRGNKAGTIPVQRPGFPAFYDLKDEASLMLKRQWIKEHLALCFRMWGDLGFGHGVSGHITVKVSLGSSRSACVCVSDLMNVLLIARTLS